MRTTLPQYCVEASLPLDQINKFFADDGAASQPTTEVDGTRTIAVLAQIMNHLFVLSSSIFDNLILSLEPGTRLKLAAALANTGCSDTALPQQNGVNTSDMVAATLAKLAEIINRIAFMYPNFLESLCGILQKNLQAVLIRDLVNQLKMTRNAYVPPWRRSTKDQLNEAIACAQSMGRTGTAAMHTAETVGGSVMQINRPQITQTVVPVSTLMDESPPPTVLPPHSMWAASRASLRPNSCCDDCCDCLCCCCKLFAGGGSKRY